MGEAVVVEGVSQLVFDDSVAPLRVAVQQFGDPHSEKAVGAMSGQKQYAVALKHGGVGEYDVVPREVEEILAHIGVGSCPAVLPNKEIHVGGAVAAGGVGDDASVLEFFC